MQGKDTQVSMIEIKQPLALCYMYFRVFFFVLNTNFRADSLDAAKNP